MPAPTSARRLAALFRRTPVADTEALERVLPGRSRRSLYRDLSELGYLASYSHAGKYYALVERVPFDEEGLWIHQGIGFSVHGTLKATACRLVEVSEAGKTPRELAERLGVRVHNTLLDLVEERRIGRKSLGPVYLYVSAGAARAAAQVEKRQASVETAARAREGLPAMLVVEVLLAVIRGSSHPSSSATGIARRLAARGVSVTASQVEAVLLAHGIGKKGRHSRSRPSRR